MKIRMTLLLALIPLFSTFLQAADAASKALNASASPVTVAAAAAVTNTAETAPTPVSTPHHFKNAFGIEVGIPGRVIPGISYSRILDENTFATIFAGGIYTNDVFAGLVSLNGYILLNEYFYLGLGVGVAVDEDGSVIIGAANPSAGLIVDITEEIKFYVETTIWFFRYNVRPDIDNTFSTDNPLFIFKAGVKYYFSWLNPLPEMKDIKE